MRKRPLILSSLVVLATAACTNSNSTAASDGGPIFLAFGANKTKLVGGADRLVITAALTDPDGIDDLVGGTLVRTESSVLIGAFATSAAEGAYSLDLDVKTLLGDVAVPRRLGAIAPFALTAKFFDQAGNEATNALELTIECEDGEVFSNGTCAEAFKPYPVADAEQCIAFEALVDTDMTCGETCSALVDTTAAKNATLLMLAHSECFCGPCTPL